MVYDAARHAQPMDSLSPYRSEKAFGYAVGINSGSEGIRRLEKAEGVCNVCLSCVSTGICGRERGRS